MGSLERRLERLESLDPSSSADDRRVSREVLRRMTEEELNTYEEILERPTDQGEPVRTLPEDEPTVRRVWELYEEVSGELAQKT